jgi:hypothetical protein
LRDSKAQLSGPFRIVKVDKATVVIRDKNERELLVDLVDIYPVVVFDTFDCICNDSRVSCAQRSWLA